MRSSRVGAAMILAALMLPACGCAPAPRSLEASVEGALPDDGTTATLSLADVVDGNWDRYLVVCPYESGASVEERLGFAWPQAPDLSMRDDRQVLALISDGTVAEHALFDRAEVDLCADGGWEVRRRGTPIELRRPAGEGTWLAVGERT